MDDNGSMTKITDGDGLIATGDLNLKNVPSPDSGRDTLEAFCLTIDGYQDGKYSIDELLREAERVERGGLENANLDDLRTAAFIRQREYRWSTDQGQENEPLLRKIRELVDEIRRRISS
jgi:hypothetical protein